MKQRTLNCQVAVNTILSLKNANDLHRYHSDMNHIWKV